MNKRVTLTLVVTIVAILMFGIAGFANAQGQSGRGGCPEGTVKFEVGEGEYDYTDDTATVEISDDGLTAMWTAEPGYIVTSVCITAGPGNQDPYTPDAADEEWTSDRHEIGAVVLTTEAAPEDAEVEEVEAEDVGAGISWLFAQNADSGSMTSDGGSTYTLTLEGVSAVTLWFSDQPSRKVGHTPTQDFIDGWLEKQNSLTPPVAIMMTAVFEADDFAMAMMAFDPVYDADAETLTYTIIIQEDLPEFTDGEMVVGELPTEFGAGVLFFEPVERTPWLECPSICNSDE
jgi:hypothetical protein